MTDRNDRAERSKQRAETAREHDDSDIIESMEDAPSHGDRQGQRPARDVGTRDELKKDVGDGGVTRVRAGDKKEEANLPRFNRK